MIIRIGYDIQFEAPAETPIVTLLNVHPSREKDLIASASRAAGGGDQQQHGAA